MVRQHKLLIVASALTVCGAVCGSCVDGDIAEVESVTIATHVDDWREEVIYQLMTDRFANGDPRNDYRVDPAALARYQGGDYQGVIDRLDYLEELGVTALWISPIVMNVDFDAGFDAYHGYWAQDLTRLNPHFGDLATLRKLVNEVHARDMKVILDIVTNHFGQVFYYDINNNGQPDEWLAGSGPGMAGQSASTMNGALSRVTEYDPDYDPNGVQAFTSLGLAGPAPIRFFDMPEIWRVPPMPEIFQRPEAYNRRGRVTDWNVPEQVVYGDFPGGLKDLDTSRDDVREALIDSYVHWVLQLDLDGFRIDTLKHVEHEFWQVFAPEVRRRLAAAGKNNFLMFGEAFDGNDELVGSFTFDNEMDSVFYFPQKYRVYDDVFLRSGPTRAVEELFNLRATNYGDTPAEGGVGISPQQALVNFIDNHDVPRFLFETRNRDALRTALAYLLTQDGIPCIYYGTEQDYEGGNDPSNREPLWWSGYRTDGDTFRWIRRLIDLRKQNVALSRGETTLRWVTDSVEDEQDAGMLAFEREVADVDGAYALVVINTSDEATSQTSSSETTDGADMTVGAAPGSTLTDAIGGETYTVAADGTLVVELPPRGVAVLLPGG